MTPKTRSILWALGIVVLLAVVIAVWALKFLFPPLPAPIRFSKLVQLNQAWSPEQRQWFYHTSQGSHLMPYTWFLALEQPGSEKLILDPDYLSRYRLIPDPDSANNPDHLPVGFAKDVAEPTDPPSPIGTGIDYVGISCAGCHTELITYKGTGVRIDGGPGQLDLVGFLEDVGKVFALMVIDEDKFDRFAQRVLGSQYNDANKGDLKEQMTTYMGTELPGVLQQVGADVTAFLVSDRSLKPTTAGFGRLDALGQGGNTLFGKLTPKNLRVLNGPVDVIPLWNAHLYGFVQSNSSIRQPMARNVIEAMAVNATVVLPNTVDGEYPSTVRLGCSWEMEQMASKLTPPQWPERLFGTLDQGKVERGKKLYQKFCAACHQPRRETWYSSEWTQWPIVGTTLPRPPKAKDPIWQDYLEKNQISPNPLYNLPTFSVDFIGTDPNDAANFANRTVDATAMGLSDDEPGAAVIYPAIAGIMATYYNDRKIPSDTQNEWNGYRSNYWRAPKAYPARPLAGVWATAPFLHNGSVPNLYELLSPVPERSATFYLGNPEFDPKRVGFQSGRFAGGFKLDTSVSGNSNAGHEYTNDKKQKGRLGRELTADERWELIEYLKALQDESPLPGPSAPPPTPPTCACQPTTSGYVCPPPAWFQNPGSASPPAGWPQSPGGPSPSAGEKKGA
ncbi:MAG TPA: di-heme-cytochrome C peroxidase [Thermoanaerobaculia bacterium]|nr:di-heme-cytochrome C peroxidase [Thermoanaerobaculia bacterium]